MKNSKAYDEAVKIMAEAAYPDTWPYFSDHLQEELRTEMDRALKGLSAAGYALVPREATEAMAYTSATFGDNVEMAKDRINAAIAAGEIKGGE
jgi:hypothetical protein